MKRSTLVGSVAACICLGLSAPLLAAEPAASGAANNPLPGGQSATAAKPAAKCLSDLRTFDSRMRQDGYWLSGAGYGYGYPIDGPGYGYSYPVSNRLAAPNMAAYRDARPGYEVRTLVAAANILARHGQQQPCETVLATTRNVYQRYAADMHSSGAAMANVPGWQQQQIATATPVTGRDASFRSDELLGTDVRNSQNEALGSIDDIVMSPATGKIAYLVIARGGIFGIDPKYVPVPWEDFKATPAASLLVLDTTKVTMAAAPLVDHDQFATPGRFDQQSQKVDAYWKTHLSNNSTTKTNG
jgi:sporulation protein YlmC with PRC-barrel domain